MQSFPIWNGPDFIILYTTIFLKSQLLPFSETNICSQTISMLLALFHFLLHCKKNVKNKKYRNIYSGTVEKSTVNYFTDAIRIIYGRAVENKSIFRDIVWDSNAKTMNY